MQNIINSHSMYCNGIIMYNRKCLPELLIKPFTFLFSTRAAGCEGVSLGSDTWGNY